MKTIKNTILAPFIFSLIWLISLLLITSCGETDECAPKDQTQFYIDVDCIIVEKIPIIPVLNHTSKAFLIRMISDTTKYSEFTNVVNDYMEDEYYYNHEVGDTLHFDYVRRERFFIKK